MAAWTDKEIEIVNKLIKKDKLYREISEALMQQGFNKSPEAIRKKYKRGLEIDDRFFTPNTIPYIGNEPIDDQYFEAIERMKDMKNKLVKITTNRFVKTGRPVNANTKILSLSDFHIPFVNEDIIRHALENHGDADILVLNGDILDCHMVSKWHKNRTILLRWEYELALEWIKIFSKAFRAVVLVSGNHEARLKSYFSTNIDPAVNFLVSDDMLAKLAKGYDFHEDGTLVQTYKFNNVYYDTGPLSWYTLIGKTIFIHPSNYSKIEMRTSTNVADNMLDREDFQCMIVAHTHHAGRMPWRSKLLIEQGCCCVPLDYESEGRMKYGPQTFGYAIVYMDKQGNVDYNKTDYIYYGTGTAVKIEDALRLL